MAKKVLILFSGTREEMATPFVSDNSRVSYEYFFKLSEQAGIKLYRAPYQWYDNNSGIFKYAWEFEKDTWNKVSYIQPDLIYDKTTTTPKTDRIKELVQKHCPVINDPIFTRILNDKINTSLIFPQWSKKSWLIRNEEDFVQHLPHITTSKVVLKPLTGSGGRGIEILEKDAIKQTPCFDRLYLMQDFIDSSKGVPGVNSSTHDLRLVFVNDILIYSYIREPKKGSLLANVAQGGTLTILSNEKIPLSINPIIAHANQAFATFDPRIYTIDIMFDENNFPWVVELNSMPGLYFDSNEKSSITKLFHELIRVFNKKLNV